MEQVVNVAGADVGCQSTGQGVFTGVPLCTLVIPNSLLLQLHEKKTCYVDAVNTNIKGNAIELDRSCARLENSLQKIARKLYTKLRHCKGSRDRARVSSGFSNFLVGQGEAITVSAVALKVCGVCVCVCI